jgi:hypothetical protein
MELTRNTITIKRRLGKSPAARSNTKCIALNGCPDLFELEDGRFAVIGTLVTGGSTIPLPADAGIGDGECLVILPREVLMDALDDLKGPG